MALTVEHIYTHAYENDRAHDYEFRGLVDKVVAGTSCISIHPLLSHRRLLFLLGAAQCALITGKKGILFCTVTEPSALELTIAARIGIHIHTVTSHAELMSTTLAHENGINHCQLMLVPVRYIDPPALANMALQLTAKIGWIGIAEAQTMNQHSLHYEPLYEYVLTAHRQYWLQTPLLFSAAAVTNTEYALLAKKVPNAYAEAMPLRDLVHSINAVSFVDQANQLSSLIKIIKNATANQVVFCSTDHEAARIQRWLSKNTVTAVTIPTKGDATTRLQFNQQFSQSAGTCIVVSGPLPGWIDSATFTTVVHLHPPARLTDYVYEFSSIGSINSDLTVFVFLPTEELQRNPSPSGSGVTNAQLESILTYLTKIQSGVSYANILNNVLLSEHAVQCALAHLRVTGCVSLSQYGRYSLTSQRWDAARHGINQPAILSLEAAPLRTYLTDEQCLGQIMSAALGDDGSFTCGRCGVCTGTKNVFHHEQNILVRAMTFIKEDFVAIIPKTHWPAEIQIDKRNDIPAEYTADEGKALCLYDDPAYGRLIRLHLDEINPDLIVASVSILRRWLQRRALDQKVITTIPSSPTKAQYLDSYARAIAQELNITFLPLIRTRSTFLPQSTMPNQLLRAANTYTGYEVLPECRGKHIILFDDVVDTGWSMTTAAYLLRKNGSGTVHPYAFALKSQRETDVR